jgi:serine protease Do
MGISFAIPIDEAILIATELRATGKVVRGRIGLSILPVPRDETSLISRPGAMVKGLEAGGAAERGGLKIDDIIVSYEGKTIEKSSDLPRFVGGTRPGVRATMQVLRAGKPLKLTIVIGE